MTHRLICQPQRVLAFKTHSLASTPLKWKKNALWQEECQKIVIKTKLKWNKSNGCAVLGHYLLIHETIKHLTICIFFRSTVEDSCEEETDVATHFWLKKVKVEEIWLVIMICYCFSCCFFCENLTSIFMYSTGHYNRTLIVLYIVVILLQLIPN